MADGTRTKVGVLDKAMAVLQAFERGDVALHRKFVPLVREAAARASRSLGFEGVLPSSGERETA